MCIFVALVVFGAIWYYIIHDSTQSRRSRRSNRRTRRNNNEPVLPVHAAQGRQPANAGRRKDGKKTKSEDAKGQDAAKAKVAPVQPPQSVANE